MKTIEPESTCMLDSAPPEQPRRAVAQPAPAAGRNLLIGLIVALLFCVLAGAIPRWRARAALQDQTEQLAIRTVSVIKPRMEKQQNAFLLPGEVRALIEAPIYARTNGYVKRWLVDIGAEVKSGDLLAEIDTPDLDQELANAQAQAIQAEAAERLAKSTAVRYNQLRKTSAISEQDAEERNSDADAKAGAAEAARASVRRYRDLQAFQKVVAPFDGLITQRNTDVGQLVTTSGGQPLFQLAQSHALRVFVHTPENLVPSIFVGQTAKLNFPELPGREFTAKVVRTAGAIDLTSRTLLTELELDNTKGEVLAGSHAEVHFAVSSDQPLFTLPSNAFLFRSEGPQAAVVVDGKVALRTIKMGRDFGRTIEVLDGIKETDAVILNPADSLEDRVEVRVIPAKGDK